VGASFKSEAGAWASPLQAIERFAGTKAANEQAASIVVPHESASG
jgi:hypothetical protein